MFIAVEEYRAMITPVTSILNLIKIYLYRIKLLTIFICVTLRVFLIINVSVAMNFFTFVNSHLTLILRGYNCDVLME